MAPLDGLAAVHFLSSLAGGQQVANTIHISNPGSGAPPSPADLADLADDLDSFFTTTYQSILKTTATFDAIKVAQVPDPTIPGDAYADYILPINVAGTRATVDETAPNQACLCLSLKTNSGQRSYRGHLLLPPSQHARDMDGQNWNVASAYYSACDDFAGLLQQGCSGSHTWTGAKLSSYYLSIYSKRLQVQSLPSVSGVITVVTNKPIHWLRSRARGTVQSATVGPADMQAPYSTRLFEANVSTHNAATDVYTVPTGKVAILRCVTISYVSAGSAILQRSGGGVWVYRWTWSADRDTLVLDLRYVLNAGETLQLYNGAGQFQVTGSGFELDAQVSVDLQVDVAAIVVAVTALLVAIWQHRR